MILTIDIGNNNITLGGFISDKLCFVSRISTNQSYTADEIAIRILDSIALHQVDRKDIFGVIVSSVVPPLNIVINKAVNFLFAVQPIFIGPGIKSGIGIPTSLRQLLYC